MTLFSRFLILAALLATPSVAEAGDVALKDGVITYSDGSVRRSVAPVGGPCSDLWVSPDGQMIAFIRIDSSQPDPSAISPFVERSTIFVASRSAGFKPMRVALDPPHVEGREWNVFFEPVLSPDLKTVYFEVPAAGTSWLLMSVPVAGGKAKPITWVDAYCVLWGGERSGDLLAMTPTSAASMLQGVLFRYVHYNGAGDAEPIGTQGNSGDWGDVVRNWTRRHGGTCEGDSN